MREVLHLRDEAGANDSLSDRIKRKHGSPQLLSNLLLRSCSGARETAVARWSPPVIDTGTAYRYDPAAPGFFHHNSFAERIFCRNYLPTLGIRTGGGECDVLVRARHVLSSAR